MIPRKPREASEVGQVSHLNSVYWWLSYCSLSHWGTKSGPSAGLSARAPNNLLRYKFRLKNT